MRAKTTDKTMQDQEVVDSYLGYPSSSLPSSSSMGSTPLGHKSYHELADVPVVESDVLAQLHTNLELLTDLQGRLSFVMREIRYLMKV